MPNRNQFSFTVLFRSSCWD